MSTVVKDTMSDPAHIDLDQLIDYFEGRLADEQARQIDRHIEESETFAAWVDEVYAGWLREPENYREKVKAFQQDLNEALRARLAGKVNGPNDAPPPLNSVPGARRPRRMVVRLVTALAAACAVGFAVFTFWPRPCPLQDYNCIISRTGGLYQEGLTRMGGDPEAEIQQAVEAYNGGEYVLAAEGITSLLEQDLTPFQRNELSLLLGLSELQEGNAGVAISAFEPLLENAPPTLREEARWYAALAYLHREEYDGARPLLAAIEQAAGPRADAARRLLARLPEKK